MFERLAARAERMARRRAYARRDKLAARLREAAPRGIDVETEVGGVRLSGRGLARRFALDAALRWLIGEQMR